MNNYSDLKVTVAKVLKKSLAIVVLGMFGFVTSAHGQIQKTAVLNRMVTQLDSLIRVTSQQVALPHQSADLSEVYALFHQEMDLGRTPDIPKADIIEAEKRSLRQDNGLQFEAGYLHNLEQGVFGAEGIFYDRRYQAGVKWDVLNNGFLDHNAKAKTLEREKEILRINHQEKISQQRIQELQNMVDAAITHQQLDHLENYRNALSVRRTQLRDLYALDYKSWNEVRKLIDQEAELTVEYKTLSEQQRMNTGEVPQTPFNLPVFTLDIEQVKRALHRKRDQMKIDSLRLENIEDRHQPWREISLSAQLRYNYYSDQSTQLLINDPGNREYFSVGVNLSVPFTVFKDQSPAYVSAYRKDFEYENQQQIQESETKFRELYAEYQNLLADYTKRYYQHRLQARQIQSIRYNGQMNELKYNRASILSHRLKQFEIKGQLIEIKGKLYDKLLQIHSLVPELSLRNYTNPWNPPELFQEGKPIDNDIYIWSQRFEKNPEHTLIQYLDTTKIQRNEL